MKFLANENIPLTSVETLRGGGSDVLAIAETSPGLPDREVLSTAVEERRIILTFDRDYGELIFRRELPRPPGVVLFRARAQLSTGSNSGASPSVSEIASITSSSIVASILAIVFSV